MYFFYRLGMKKTVESMADCVYVGDKSTYFYRGKLATTLSGKRYVTLKDILYFSQVEFSSF